MHLVCARVDLSQNERYPILLFIKWHYGQKCDNSIEGSVMNSNVRFYDKISWGKWTKNRAKNSRNLLQMWRCLKFSIISLFYLNNESLFSRIISQRVPRCEKSLINFHFYIRFSYFAFCIQSRNPKCFKFDRNAARTLKSCTWSFFQTWDVGTFGTYLIIRKHLLVRYRPTKKCSSRDWFLLTDNLSGDSAAWRLNAFQNEVKFLIFWLRLNTL